ncbi:PTS lactose/cellobiose transporter subunit IIA [Olsenella sp. YH-ols2217]|uniref:PTS lactose/cellobiose transporter subunit IIA n=1 Tax=Kribbibacterium absianum TaxID=3044210 RepID=A0ABT6ZKN7_9ACTN|nr:MULTISPECIES: PTS lactose/cellobiose transporter subunit IIA [unclassified Olsenella]MDJ1122665.1 PTS lactose/cellobiose transporter subunit IIA [Olsenella sp. YH-ols2216]MDJ1129103.1 PTS lactose/cellobiose transporter subunit IIA [Olsenella sp. YH-ols2217]
MDINEVAMGVIINACNGRDKIDKAFDAMGQLDFDAARALLEEADKDLLQAHNAQTETIQAQAAGENTEYSLLFTHAQDTLMTITSEHRIAKNLLNVFEAMSAQIETLRA